MILKDSEFVLSIHLGNEAMNSTEDVADALERTAHNLRLGRSTGMVFDANGNKVGSWTTI